MNLLPISFLLSSLLLSAIPAYAQDLSMGYKTEEPPKTAPAATPTAMDDSSVAITSPKKDQMTGPDVAVMWELKKGSKADHVHLYLDGTLKGPQYGDSYQLKGLKPGKHTIELKTTTKGHDILGPSDSVTITVE